MLQRGLRLQLSTAQAGQALRATNRRRSLASWRAEERITPGLGSSQRSRDFRTSQECAATKTLQARRFVWPGAFFLNSCYRLEAMSIGFVELLLLGDAKIDDGR